MQHTKYEKVGEALGARGVLLSGENAGDIDGELRAAIDRSRTGESTVINAIIGTTDFRAGSISV